jgi:hypothetical protein
MNSWSWVRSRDACPPWMHGGIPETVKAAMLAKVKVTEVTQRL